MASRVIVTRPLKHPSGRPQRNAPYRNLSITRAPRDEPLTPGLRQRGLAQAVGFHVAQASDDDGDYGKRRR